MSFFVSPIVALIVLVPLLGCVAVLLDALADKSPPDAKAAPKKKAPPAVRWSERAVVFGAGGSLVSAAIALVKLLATGASYGYFHLLRCVRIGQIDASLTLSIDALRGIGAFAVAAGASWAALLLAKRATPRVHGALLLLLAGAELVIVADGALGIVMGLSALGAGASLSIDPRAAWLARAAGISAGAVLVGASILAWSAGGSWTAGDYTPELYPRFTLTKKPVPASEDAKKRGHEVLDAKKLAFVSMAPMGAAFLYVDEARTPWEIDKRPVHPPFAEEPIAAGIHSFRIHQGYGMDDHVLAHVSIEEGQNSIIIPSGATLSPREVRAQIDAAPEPTDDVPMLTVDTLRSVNVDGIRAALLVQLLFAFAAALLAVTSLAWGRGRPDVFARARSLALLAAAATIAYRVDFLARLPSVVWILIVGAAAALGFFVSRKIDADPEKQGDSKLFALVLRLDRDLLDLPLRALSFVKKPKVPPTAIAIFFALGALLAPRDARASDIAAGDIVLSANGTRGPLVLEPKGQELAGTFEIENHSKSLITVARVSVRSDPRDVRAPSVLTLKTDGPFPMAVAAGAKSKVTVTLGRTARVEELYANIVVTTNLDNSNELVMGVVGHTAQRNAEPFGRNILSMSVVVFFAAGAIALLLSLLKTPFGGRAAALGSFAGVALLGLLVHRFEPALTKADGNDGLSFIERGPLAILSGAELYFAADGLAIVVAIAIAGAAALALLFVADDSSVPPFERPFLLFSAGSAIGATFAQDLFLFAIFFAGAAGFGALCVRAAQPDGAVGFARVRIFALLASIAVLVAVFGLYGASDRAYAIDGTLKEHSFAIQDLARVLFTHKSATLLGAPLVKSAFVLLAVAFAMIAGVPPFHGATIAILVETKRPTALTALAIMRGLGLYGLVHVAVQVLPDACRWGAGGLAWLGVLGAIFAGACAIAEKGLGRRLGYLLAAQAGITLFGFAAVAPQGIVAVLFGIFSMLAAHLACGALALLGGKMNADTNVTELDARTRGVLVLAALGCGAAPLFPGFHAAFSGVVGGAARNPGIVLLVILAFGLTTAATASLVRAAFGAPLPAAKPMQTAHNWGVFLLVIATGVTGVFPATCLDLAANAIRDRVTGADPPGGGEVG